MNRELAEHVDTLKPDSVKYPQLGARAPGVTNKGAVVHGLDRVLVALAMGDVVMVGLVNDQLTDLYW